MKTRLLLATAALSLSLPAFAGPASPTYTPDLLPPVSNAGECYARVKVPARYETVEQTVMTNAPYQTTQVTQPRFETRQEDVLVKEQSVRYEVRQPTFKTVIEKIMTRPAYEKLSVSPPQFSTVSETLSMSEPRLVWKKGNPADLIRQGYTIHSTADGGRYGQGYGSTTQYGATGGERCGPTCEIWCLVEEPGVQKTFQRRVMSNPGGVQRHAVPAQYQSISRQVVADPGGVREIPVPAEFRSVTVHDLVDAGGAYAQNTPPTYGTVQANVMVEAERYEWRRVLCQPGTQTGGAYGATHAQPHSSPAYGSTSTQYDSRGGTGGNMNYSLQPGMAPAPAPAPAYGGSSTYGSTTTYGGTSHSSGSTGYIEAYPFNDGGSHNSSTSTYSQPAYTQPAYGQSTHTGDLAGGYHRQRNR